MTVERQETRDEPWRAPLTATTQRDDVREPECDRFDADAARERMLAYRLDAAKRPLR